MAEVHAFYRCCKARVRSQHPSAQDNSPYLARPSLHPQLRLERMRHRPRHLLGLSFRSFRIRRVLRQLGATNAILPLPHAGKNRPKPVFSFNLARSFPLDGGRRLARHVVGDAGDAFDFIDDAAADGFQQFVRQVRPTCGHKVDGFHRAQGDDPGVTTAITNHAHRLHRLEHDEGLADLVVPVGLAQLFDKDVVSATQQVGVFLLHFTEDAHTQAWAREGVTVDHVVRQAEFQTQATHFVLEQFAQWLDQFQVHFFRQAADVVVRLDHVGLAAFRASRLDHVRVDGALGEELDVVQLAGFGIEHVDKGTTDDLALLLRVRFAGQVIEELLLGVGADHFDAHVLGEHGHHLLAFMQAQQAVVDEYAGQLIADGLVQQRRDHRGIHTAGQAEQHVGAADLGAHIGDGVFNDVGGGPQGFTAADFQDKAREDATALLGVGHFRVELHAVVAAAVVRHGGDRAARGAGEDMETFRQSSDLVAVTHPDVEAEHAVVVDVIFDTVEQTGLANHVNAGITELTQLGAFNLAAQLLGHGLHAVADTKNRYTEVEHGFRCTRAVGFMHRLRATGEDDAARGEGTDVIVAHIERVQLAIHADLAHAAGDQLGVLGAEIQNQDAVSVDVLMSHGRLS